MRVAASLLAAYLALAPARAFSAYGPQEEEPPSNGEYLPPITVTAPRGAPALEKARAAGAVTAAAGTGLLSYVVLFGRIVPFGWAAAPAFFGGMTGYLSDRRLDGIDDFSPRPAAAPPAPVPLPEPIYLPRNPAPPSHLRPS